MRHLFGLSLVTLLGTSLLTPSLAQLSTETAPTGSYTATATLENTASVKSGGGIRARKVGTGSGVKIKMTITSYSPKSEVDAANGAGKGNLATTIGGFNHGTVTLGEQTYTINLATSFRSGNNYRINLVSSKSFSRAGFQNTVTTTDALGYITLLVPVSGGEGSGSLYNATGVTVSTSGNVENASGGAAAKAKLTAVIKGS